MIGTCEAADMSVRLFGDQVGDVPACWEPVVTTRQGFGLCRDCAEALDAFRQIGRAVLVCVREEN